MGFNSGFKGLNNVFVAATKHNSKMTKSYSVSQEILCSPWNPRVQFDGVQKNQPDARLILSIYGQPVHVSGVSRPIIRRYNRPGWTTDSHLKE